MLVLFGPDQSYLSCMFNATLCISHVDVLNYTGQFLCGNKRCENKEGLKSWEVNFAYVEQGEKRNALVKLRKCWNHTNHAAVYSSGHHTRSWRAGVLQSLAPTYLNTPALMFQVYQARP